MCGGELKLTLPTVVDDLEDTVNQLYSAWPERIYLVDAGGTVLYRAGLGPWGFKPDEAQAEIEKVLL